MRNSRLLLLLPATLGLLAPSLAADASMVINNIPGTYAIANLPGGGDQDLEAIISITSRVTGKGTNVTINVNGGGRLPGGPFMYHIHEFPVPSDGNCTGTGAHLDTTGRGETPPCNSSQPETCQVGDLSGKHGECEQIPGCSLNFTDDYLSLTAGDPAYVGNRSIVFHFHNKTRLACANFKFGSNTLNNTNSSSSTSTAAGSYPTNVSGGNGTSTSGGNNPSRPSSTTQAPSSAMSIAVPFIGAKLLVLLLPVAVLLM